MKVRSYQILMRVKPFFILSMVILGLLGLLGHIGCQKGPQKVRIAFTKYTGDLPFFVAKEKGFFEKYGLNVEIKEAGDSTEALNALLVGQVDIINPISFSAMIAVEAKTPGEFKLFLPGGENENIIGSYLLVSKDSKISKIEELKGKKIGTYTGATQLLYLKLFLKEVGYNPEKDFEIIQVSYNLQAQALEAKQFDALFTIEPMATIAIEKGIAKVLVENPRVKYIVNPFISGSAAVSTKFYKQNPDVVRRVYRAVAAGIDFIKTNEKEARDILAKYTALEQSLAQKTSLLVWYKVDDQVKMDAIQKIADQLFEYGLVAKKVTLEPLFLKKEDIL